MLLYYFSICCQRILWDVKSPKHFLKIHSSFEIKACQLDGGGGGSLRNSRKHTLHGASVQAGVAAMSSQIRQKCSTTAGLTSSPSKIGSKHKKIFVVVVLKQPLLCVPIKGCSVEGSLTVSRDANDDEKMVTDEPYSICTDSELSCNLAACFEISI